jgi:hypothetical protein
MRGHLTIDFGSLPVPDKDLPIDQRRALNQLRQAGVLTVMAEFEPGPEPEPEKPRRGKKS